MKTILSRYSNLPGNRELVFRSLCALLAEDPVRVDWSGFNYPEWDLLIEIAVREGVAALAYYLLQAKPESFQRSSFDPQTIDELKENEASLTVRNALLFRHLRQVLQALSVQGIPVVLLKGADLAHSLYPEPGLRVMTDLDLLVSRASYKEALAVVHAVGYHEYLPEASPGVDNLLGHHAHLRKDSPSGPLLELHWTLIASSAFQHAVPTDWFWQNLEPCLEWKEFPSPGGQDGIFRLNPTANMLYLSAHQMLQHGGELASLRWLLDLHSLVAQRGAEIDWEGLATQANLFGWSGALRAALQAMRACFNTTLPEGLLATLQAQVGPLDALVEMKAEPAPTRILGELKRLRSLNWPGRVRLLIALVLPAPAYIRWRYQPKPGWLWPVFYIYRWIDIASDGVRSIIQILRTPSRFG